MTIMAAKKNNEKKTNSRKAKNLESEGNAVNQLERLHHEMNATLDEFKQHKRKIEELTKATIEELMKIHDLNNKAKKLQPKNELTETASNNNNHGTEIDYELTNLRMINKILSLSTPFETEKKAAKKKAKAPKIKAAPKELSRPKPEIHATNMPIKILIIEDDRTTIKIISHILEQHEAEVGFAMEAEEGLKKAFKEKPDLILLDIMLPGMDGFQMLKKLQSNEDTSDIPVLILSSLSGEKDIIKGLENGATDYILKPFSPQILFFKIKKILSLRNEHIPCDRHL